MTRSRLILSLVMMALMVVGSLIHQSDMDFAGKVFLGGIAMIFFLAAFTLMGVTFFVLDEEGRIPHGSLVWKYFAGFYATTEEKDGQTIKHVRMPERIKLCPAYWMIFLGFLGLTIALALGIIVASAVGALIIHGLPESRDAKAALFAFTGLFSFVALVIGVSKLLIRLKRPLFLNIWLYFVTFSIVAVILGFMMSANMDKGISPAEAALATGVDTAKAIGFLVAFVAACAALIGMFIGLVYLLMLILPWVASSLIGQLIAAIFRGLCPIIPVAPAPATAPTPQAENAQ